VSGLEFGRHRGVGRSLAGAQGWSFIHFCLHEPSGKYREKLLRYVRKDTTGTSVGYSSLCECIGIRDDSGWAPIEREWRAFVDKL